MVGPIIVLPSTGLGFNNPSVEHTKAPAKIYYRRFDPRTGVKHEFTWYVDKLENAKEEMYYQGHDYWMYGYEQDGKFIRKNYG
jgi:hypothetical protein